MTSGKRIRINTLPTLLLLISLLTTCQKPMIATRIINAGDYGLKEGTDATPAILKALEACKQQKASKLILPPGTYHFYPLAAYEQYVAVSNNDNSKKRIAFPIIEMQNFEIDGQGAFLIFHGIISPFIIHHSNTISLRNFSIDWERPFHSEATVATVNEKEKTFDITIPAKYKYAIQGHELMFLGEGWKQNIEQNIWFDPKTKATVYDVTKYKLDPWNPLLSTRYGAWEVAKGMVRVKDTIATLPHPGWRWIVKGNFSPNRLCSGIHIFKSKDVKVEDVNIYHAGGMGIIGERSENISLNKIKVIPTPGSDRLVSTTADATHFVGCKGFVRITHSTFENMLDDATNIHGAYTKIVGFPADNQIGVVLNHKQQLGFVFAEAGDSLTFIDNQTMLPVASHTVEKVEVINEEYMILTFKESVKKKVKEGFGVENITWYPEFYMSNCIVRQNRARSILLTSRKKMVVENNYFSSMMAGIAIGGDSNFWFESGAVTDLVIRNNTFENCCTSGQNQCAITFEPNIPKMEATNDRYHRNILIEKNIFKTFDRCILAVKSVDGLIFRNNQIIQTNTFPPLYPNKATIQVLAGSNIVIQQNDYSGISAPTVQADELSKMIERDQAFIVK